MRNPSCLETMETPQLIRLSRFHLNAATQHMNEESPAADYHIAQADLINQVLRIRSRENVNPCQR